MRHTIHPTSARTHIANSIMPPLPCQKKVKDDAAAAAEPSTSGRSAEAPGAAAPATEVDVDAALVRLSLLVVAHAVIDCNGSFFSTHPP